MMVMSINQSYFPIYFSPAPSESIIASPHPTSFSLDPIPHSFSSSFHPLFFMSYFTLHLSTRDDEFTGPRRIRNSRCAKKLCKKVWKFIKILLAFDSVGFYHLFKFLTSIQKGFWFWHCQSFISRIFLCPRRIYFFVHILRRIYIYNTFKGWSNPQL